MPFDLLLDALCDRCWAKEELYGGPLDEFEGLDGSHRFLAREGWRITRHRTLCPRCKELPPMTHPSAPQTTASSLSLRIQELERISAAVPDLEAKLGNMLRERDSMVDQLANWDRGIESTREQIKKSAEAERILSVLNGQLTQLVDREVPRVPRSGNQKRVSRDQLRAYVTDHPWSRPVEIEAALGYGRSTASAALSALVKMGEFQNVQGHYALTGVPILDIQQIEVPQRSRICAYVKAHPGQRPHKILEALGLPQSGSSHFSVLVNDGRLIRKDRRYYPPTTPAKRTPAPIRAKEAAPALPAALEEPAAPAPAPTPDVTAPASVPGTPPEQGAPTLADVQSRVLSYLQANPEHLFRAKAIAQEVEAPEAVVRTALNALITEQLVYVQTGGWYGSLDEVPEETPGDVQEQDGESGGTSADAANEPEFVEAPTQIVLQTPTPEPEPQEALPAEVPAPEPEPEVAVPEIVSVPQPAVPAPEPEISLPQTPALPQVPVAAPTPDQEFPSDDGDFPDEKEGAGNEQPGEETPESRVDTVRRLLPPRLSQDQRQVCELLVSYPQGMTPRLLAARLNWMQSRTDKTVNALLREEVLLKVAAEVRLAPKYRHGVPHA